MTYISTERIGPVNGRVRSHVNSIHRNDSRLTVAVAAISHNYGNFLPKVLHSVRSQRHRADEIVVIDDSSTDNTREVAGNFDVPYYRIDKKHQYYSMRKALDVTSSDVLCFLDGDDILPSNYLEEGMKCFSEYDVGLVYSDMERFGASNGVISFGDFSNAKLQKDNFMHAGSLVRREALVSSRALDVGIPESMACATDWYVWKQVCLEGWKARKQKAHYKYRIHESSNSLKYSDDNFDYFVRAGLAAEPVSFFTALSGRTRYWKRLACFLDEQAWPRDQSRVFLLDTSGSKKFHKTVREWALRSDYDDVRIVKFNSGERFGVADEDRTDDEVRHSVQRAVARIYNKMAREITTEYVLTIEDDVLPPLNVVKTLLRAFSSSTASVAAPLKSRYHEGYLHWYPPKEICTKHGTGVEEIGGSGFGCTMIRGSVLKDTVFTSNPQFCKGDFDGSFYHRLSGWKKKVHWDCRCIHGD